MNSQPHSFSDHDLVGFLREGSELAFTELHRRFAGVLLNAAYQRLQDKDATEELVQDLFVALWLRREQLFITGSVRAYLLTALRNRVIDYFRQQARQVELTQKDENSQWANTTEESLYFNELTAAYEQQLARLPEKCRVVFDLYRSGRTVAEIAEQLGVGVKTVESHLLKANRTLRGNLKDYALVAVLTGAVKFFV